MQELMDIRKKYNVSQDKILLLYFGRIIKAKGLDILINAFWSLPNEDRNRCFLVVAGDGNFRKRCEKIAQDRKLDNIIFIGAINPIDRKQYFEQCDIFVHPGTFRDGRTDVWGLTLNEAIQCGKIVISTTAVGSAYDLITKDNGKMVQAGNIDALSEALKFCITEPFFSQKACKEDVRIYDKYNVANMAKLYVNACYHICKQ